MCQVVNIDFIFSHILNVMLDRIQWERSSANISTKPLGGGEVVFFPKKPLLLF